MAKRSKESIWIDAINKKNEEANKRREASDFFSAEKPNKEKDVKVQVEENSNLPVGNNVKEVIVKEEVVKYTSKKPFKNTADRPGMNTHDEVLEFEKAGSRGSVKRWSIFGVLFSALLSAIIIIPLVIISAGAALIIDSALTMQELIGYKVNETKFAVKHEASDQYLQAPTYEGEQLILGDEKEETFMFTDRSYDPSGTGTYSLVADYDDLWLKSDMIFNGHEMNVSFEGGKAVWSGVNDESTIHLKKDEDVRNRFSISMNNEEAFIAKDKDSNRIVLSKNPDWFTFETQVDFITDSTSYLEDYHSMNDGVEGYPSDVTLGAEGNPLTIYSNISGKYLNSYKEVSHGDLPFLLIDRNEYKESLRLGNETDTNLFIQTNTLGDMVLSSYQTLPLERYATNEWQKYYPIVSAKEDGTVILESYDLSAYTNESLETSDISNAQFWLLPNPNNLREKAIYFPALNKFLDTTTGNLKLKEITSEEEIKDLDFFTLSHSPNKNPENTDVRVGGSIFGTRKGIVEIEEDFKLIDGYEFYGYGYDSLLELETNPANYKTEVREKTNSTKRKSVIELRNLEENSCYHGILATYRNQESGVGKHVTFTYVPVFWTGDKGINWPDTLPNINWPDINWPDIGWPSLPVIDPGDPIVDGGNGDAATAEIWDSTDEVNSGSSNDIPVEEMLTAASTEIEVTVKVTQGTQDGVTKDLGVRLQETDESGNIITSGYDETQTLGRRPVSDQEYTTVFEGLNPETNYIATVIFYDGHKPFEQVQSDPLQLDHGQTQMKATSERVAPTYLEDVTSYDWDSTGSGFSVYMVANDLRATDQIMVRLENQRTNEVSTTGWVAVQDWTTTSIPNWTLSFNDRADGDYYEATFNNDIALDSYNLNMWVRMDTSTDFIGWDEDSPAFDQNYSLITSESEFDVIEILNEVDITATKKHIIK